MQDAADFAAHQVFPVTPVDLPSGRYQVFPRSYFAMDHVGPRPLGGYPRSVGYRESSDTYSAEEEALEAWLDDRERARAATARSNPERNKVRLLTNQHLIHRDRAWADSFFKTGIWGTEREGVASGPTGTQFLRWDNDNSTPIKQIQTEQAYLGRINAGHRPNTLVLGVDAEIALLNHPSIIGRIGQNQEVRAVRRGILAQLFNVERVVVPLGVYNAGPEAETYAATEAAADYRYIVDTKAALLVYTSPEDSQDSPSGGRIFSWTGLLGNQAFPRGGGGALAAVTRGRDGRAYSDWFHVRMAYDMKITAPTTGMFFRTAVS